MGALFSLKLDGDALLPGDTAVMGGIAVVTRGAIGSVGAGVSSIATSAYIIFAFGG